MQLSVFRSYWFICLVLVLLGGCEKRPQSVTESATPQAQETGPDLLYFTCRVPRLLADRVTAMNLVAQVAGENTDSRSGIFSTLAVLLTWSDGSEDEIVLDESYGFTAKDPVHHNGCDDFHFHAVGDLLFFDYSYGTGNPYPAQQVLYLQPGEHEFRGLDRLGFTLDDGYLEFQGNDCIETLVKGDGVVQRVCVLDGRMALFAKRLEAELQEDSRHSFLCDLSKEPSVVLEYNFRPFNSEVLEYLPGENQVKMQVACGQYQAKSRDPKKG